MRSRWPILALLCVLASLLVPGIASASTASVAETRVWAFDLQDQAHVGVERSLTLELRRGCAPTYDQLASDSLLAAKGVNKVDDAAKAVGDWLGDRARVITNKSGDKVFINEAGTRRVRFDLNNPHPHQNPHMHVEELVEGQWVKSGPIYPTGVPDVP